MPMTAIEQPVAAPTEHLLTVQEALEPLFLRLEQEAEFQLIAAAVEAGWSPDDVLPAIDKLRKQDAQTLLGQVEA